MKLDITMKVQREVKYLKAECGVRYWEDGTVNGEQDTDGSRIPLRDPKPNDSLGGGTWCPTIELETGRILNWPPGVVASIHYKVCDDGLYRLLDPDCNEVAQIDGYVPAMMSPKANGYGDYVIMDIGPDGRIENWQADLSPFEAKNDD